MKAIVTGGYRRDKVNQDGTDGCPAEGCTRLLGQIAAYRLS